MSITKFEVGKKYRFLKDGDGDKLYNGVDAKAGQEFTVSSIDDVYVYTYDVTYKGNSNSTEWTVYMEKDTYCTTTLGDFEEVVKVSDEGVDFERYVCDEDIYCKVEQPIETNDRLLELVPSDINTEEENILPDLIKELITLQQEHNLVLMFHGGEVVINFENSDTEYQVSSQEELTTLIEASKVMKRFERKEN